MNAAITKRQIGLVHVAKNELGLSEDEYRAILSRLGVKSSTELTGDMLDDLMTYFGQLGFIPRPGAKKSRRGRFDRRSPRSRDRLMKKIDAQLKDMGLTWSYADGICKKMFGIDMVEFCDSDKLSKIVAALTYHQRRKETLADGKP